MDKNHKLYVLLPSLAIHELLIEARSLGLSSLSLIEEKYLSE
jgi:hypothetical protein